MLVLATARLYSVADTTCALRNILFRSLIILPLATTYHKPLQSLHRLFQSAVSK